MRILVVLFVSACSSYSTAPPASSVVTPALPVPEDIARVCVVRTSALAQAVAFPTRDNGVLVGATKGPTHFCYLVEPGHHRLTMSADNTAVADLEAVGGRGYTLHQEVEFIFGVVNVRPSWVAPERADELFSRSEYEVLSSVPGSEKLPNVREVVRATHAPSTD